MLAWRSDSTRDRLPWRVTSRIRRSGVTHERWGKAACSRQPVRSAMDPAHSPGTGLAVVIAGAAQRAGEASASGATWNSSTAIRSTTRSLGHAPLSVVPLPPAAGLRGLHRGLGGPSQSRQALATRGLPTPHRSGPAGQQREQGDGRRCARTRPGDDLPEDRRVRHRRSGGC
jgi:hypothetical protein